MNDDDIHYGQSITQIKDGKKRRVPLVNVGTIGHCDHGKIRQILVIVAGMGLHVGPLLDIATYNELDAELSLHTLERLYAAIDIKPEKLHYRQSWQAMNRGKLSKKQRRK